MSPGKMDCSVAQAHSSFKSWPLSSFKSKSSIRFNNFLQTSRHLGHFLLRHEATRMEKWGLSSGRVCSLGRCSPMFIWKQAVTNSTTYPTCLHVVCSGKHLFGNKSQSGIIFPILPRRKWSLCQGGMTWLNFWLESVSSQSWDYACWSHSLSPFMGIVNILL